MSYMRTFIVTVNDKTYTVRARDVDDAMCSAYRKYYMGKSNVFDNIMWYVGKTKEQMSVKEVTNV